MERVFLEFLNTLLGEPVLREVRDFAKLSSCRLLRLADQLPDELLPFFVRLLKESRGGTELFARLMGDHDEENRELVDRFFARYMNLVIEPQGADFNPLIHYLDPQMFHDIALIQTREQFFKRQTIEHINEFLNLHFDLERPFQAGEQDLAWEFFFQEILKS